MINRVNSREYLGKSALIPELHEPTVFESNMMRLTLDESVHPRYAVHVLQTSFIKRQIMRACKDAVNQSSINQQDVKGFELPVPPIDRQIQFATALEGLHRTKSAYQSAIDETGVLISSLQGAVFGKSQTAQNRQ